MAGLAKERLILHEKAFAASGSPSLKALVDGPFKESGEGVVDWSHTEADTVKRFLTYLYVCDYNAPWPTKRPSLLDDGPSLCKPSSRWEPQILKEEHGLEVPEVELATTDEPVEEFAAEPVEEVAEEVAEDLEEELKVSPDVADHVATHQAPFDPAITRPLTPIDKCIEVEQGDQEDHLAAGLFDKSEYPYREYCYIEPMLAHARLYALANYHLCPSLRTLALQRLVRVLDMVDCTQDHAVEEMNVLAKFVYDNTVPPHDGEEPMRKVISTFVALHYPRLLRRELEELFSQGGDLPRDVSRRISRRLYTMQQSIEAVLRENEDLRQEVDALRPKSKRHSKW